MPQNDVAMANAPPAGSAVVFLSVEEEDEAGNLNCERFAFLLSKC